MPLASLSPSIRKTRGCAPACSGQLQALHLQRQHLVELTAPCAQVPLLLLLCYSCSRCQISRSRWVESSGMQHLHSLDRGKRP